MKYFFYPKSQDKSKKVEDEKNESLAWPDHELHKEHTQRSLNREQLMCSRAGDAVSGEHLHPATAAAVSGPKQ